MKIKAISGHTYRGKRKTYSLLVLFALAFRSPVNLDELCDQISYWESKHSEIGKGNIKKKVKIIIYFLCRARLKKGERDGRYLHLG